VRTGLAKDVVALFQGDSRLSFVFERGVQEFVHLVGVVSVSAGEELMISL
jgi:hypothetical protein